MTCFIAFMSFIGLYKNIVYNDREMEVSINSENSFWSKHNSTLFAFHTMYSAGTD